MNNAYNSNCIPNKTNGLNYIHVFHNLDIYELQLQNLYNTNKKFISLKDDI